MRIVESTGKISFTPVNEVSVTAPVFYETNRQTFIYAIKENMTVTEGMFMKLMLPEKFCKELPYWALQECQSSLVTYNKSQADGWTCLYVQSTSSIL